MRFRLATVLAVLLISHAATADVYHFGGPRSTNNDDSCDIALLPAATLLLPYFEVDLNENRAGETTLFSVTNVGNTEQIAHVTLWTDFAYPVVAFDIYLTGYDVQSINLYDVIKLGQIAPARGTGTDVSPAGDFSTDNPALNVSSCSALPPALAPELVARMQSAFTTGRVPGCANVGGPIHARGAAVGYATIDVVSACNSQLTPADPAYYDGTLRYDNVLMGDYLQVNNGQSMAQGSPMVHVRAIPEGGSAAERRADPVRYSVNFPRTFYSRYQTGISKLADARQPLPSTFATRWVDGGAASFETFFKIWREGTAGANAPCSQYDLSAYDATDSVTFDEEENAIGESACTIGICGHDELFPATGRYHIRGGAFPRYSGWLAGWLYLNLDDPTTAGAAAQGWVVSSMHTLGRFSVDTDALALGNGCSPAVGSSEVVHPFGSVIGPAGNVNP